MSDKKIIDGYALEKAILDVGRSSSNSMLMTLTGFVTKFVNDAPEAVVRCKDCKHGKSRKNANGEDMIDCLLADNWLKHPDWFCADGERRTDNA